MAGATIRELDHRVGRGVLVLLVPLGAGVWGLSLASEPVLYLIGCGVLALLLALGTFRAFDACRLPTRVVAILLTFALTAAVLVGAPWWRMRDIHGDRVWAAQGTSPFATRRVGDFVYEFGETDVTVLRADTGVVLGTYDAGSSAQASVADNGWILFRTSGTGGVHVYDPVRGEIMHVPEDTVWAVDGSALVAGSCPGVEKPCAFHAYRPGADAAHPIAVWTRRGYESNATSAIMTADPDEQDPYRTNTLLVMAADAKASSYVVVDVTSGRTLQTVPRPGRTSIVTLGHAVAVLHPTPSCTLSVFEGGRSSWTRHLTCAAVSVTAYGSLLYVGDSAGGTTVFDAGTGASTTIGRSVWYQPGQTSQRDAAAIGGDIAVLRHGQYLTGVAADGHTLWHFDAGHDTRPPGVEQSNGAVVVLSGFVARSPLRSHHDRENDYTVTVLDAQSGRHCAQVVEPEVWDAEPVGPGLALLSDQQGNYTLVGCLPSGG